MTHELLDSLKSLALHFWRGVHWEKFPDGPRCLREPLKLSHLNAHLSGGRSVGLAPITPGQSTTRAALFDLDDHSGRMGWDATLEAAKALRRAIDAHSPKLKPRLFRSSGGKGIHIYLLWEQPQDAYSVRECLKGILADAGFTSGTKGLQYKEIEVFPKQNDVKLDGVGSMWILPFSRESLPLDEAFNLVDIGVAIYPAYWLHSEPVPVLERPAPPPAADISEPDSDEIKRLVEALDSIPNSGENSLSYDEWRNMVFAIHFTTGGSEQGRQIAETFSAKSDKFDPAFFNERVWPYIRSDHHNAITSKTVLAKAREFGYNEALSMFDDISDQPQETGGSRDAQLKNDDTFKSINTAPATPAGAIPRYKIVTSEEFATRPPLTWLIKDILPQAAIVALYGESTAGKSFVALDMAACLVRGAEWRGKKTKKSRVVYVCAEGIGGFALRVKAHILQYGNMPELGVLPEAPNFMLVDDVRDVIKAIHTFGTTDLVILDTLAQITPGANENSGEDMGLLLNHCQAIHRVTGATVMLIHHAGKDLSRGQRGWSGLKGNADAEIEVSRLDTVRLIRAAKLKDGADGAKYPFRLLPVPVDVSEDGDIIESCVIEHLPDSEASDTRGPKLKGEWQNVVYKMALGLQGVDGKGISKAGLIEACLKERDTESTYATRGHVNRAITNLEGRKIVFVEDGKVTVNKKVSEGSSEEAHKSLASLSSLLGPRDEEMQDVSDLID